MSGPSSGEEQGLSLCGLQKTEHITHIFGHHQQENQRDPLALWRELNSFQLSRMLLGCSQRGEKLVGVNQRLGLKWDLCVTARGVRGGGKFDGSQSSCAAKLERLEWNTEWSVPQTTV